MTEWLTTDNPYTDNQQQDIIDKTWYTHIYESDMIDFETYNIRYVETIDITMGQELEFSPEFAQKLLHNIKFSPHLSKLIVSGPALQNEKFYADDTRTEYWRRMMGSELWDFCEERKIWLQHEPFNWFFANYSHQLLGGERIHKHHLWDKASEANNLKVSYVSYNGRLKDHRTELVDALRQTNMWDKGHLSYAWQHYEPNAKQIDVPEWMFSDHLFPTDGSDKVDEHCITSYHLTDEFLEGFCHLITESFCEGDDTDSITDRHFVTEKTLMPIWFLRPFLVLTTPGYHKALQEHAGIEMYDEIFDYEFDELTDRRLRIVSIIKNIKNLQSRRSEWPELFELILPKLKRNRERLLKLSTDITKFPNTLFKQVLNSQHAITSPMKAYQNMVDTIVKDARVPANNCYNISSAGGDHDNRVASYIDQIMAQSPNFNNEFHLIAQTEWQTFVPDKLVEILNDKKIHLHSYWFSDSEYLDDPKNQQIPLVDKHSLYSYPWALARRMSWVSWKDITDPDDVQMEYVGTCLLARPHPHRVYVFDTLVRELGSVENIQHFNKIKVSYNGPSYIDELVWRYLEDPAILNIKNLFKFVEYDNWNDHMDSFQIRHDYENGLIDFVTESGHDCYLYTEKIFKPMAWCKPFVVLGKQGTNKYLHENHGVELFPELIDYSFDDIPDIVERSRAFTREMLRLSKLTTSECQDWYRQLWPKCLHNRELLSKYLLEGDIPEPLKQIYLKQHESARELGKPTYMYHTEYNLDDRDFMKRIELCLGQQNT